MPETKVCSKCKQGIKESHFLLADYQYWHEDCLRCVCCDARLAELDKIYYIKARMSLCRRDYLRLYGKTGECSVCQKRVQPYEFVMKVKNSVYHLSCFCCQHCQMRFCIGDRFYLHDNIILCEHDYMELFPHLFAQNINIPQTERTEMIVNTSVIESCLCLNESLINKQPSDADSVSQSVETETKLEINSNYSKCITSNIPIYEKTKVQNDYEQMPSSNTSLVNMENQLYLPPNLFDAKLNDAATISDDRSSGYGSPSSPGNSFHDKI
ncbi:unnamed protein product [Heterobilharzia americana]|nr:unnamed protein product [Heterobilharzia americana]CAH8574190.1 unnamed protein product [Heterobilharzia americana]